MSVTHMSHRDGAVTPAECHGVSHVPHEAVPPTRPDPTRPIFVVAVACGVSGQGLHACSGDLPDAMRGYAAEFGGGF